MVMVRMVRVDNDDVGQRANDVGRSDADVGDADDEDSVLATPTAHNGVVTTARDDGAGYSPERDAARGGGAPDSGCVLV